MSPRAALAGGWTEDGKVDGERVHTERSARPQFRADCVSVSVLDGALSGAVELHVHQPARSPDRSPPAAPARCRVGGARDAVFGGRRNMPRPFLGPGL